MNNLRSINRKSPRKVFFQILGSIFFLLILVFMYFKFQALIFGPQLSSISLEEYSSIQQASLELTGRVRNTEDMFLNDRSVTLGENGEFGETLVFPPGYTKIELRLTDPFGKTRFYHYHIYAEYTQVQALEKELDVQNEEEEILNEEINEEE